MVRASRGLMAMAAALAVAGCDSAMTYRDSGAKVQIQYQSVGKPIPPAPPAASSVAAAPDQRLSDVDSFEGRAKRQRPDDFALVVGIEGYQNIPAADFAERDARTVSKYLQKLGVPEENVILLTGQRATRTGLAKYLEEWLPHNVTENSRVYFYYSGHGAPDPKDGTSYLVPWDGDPSFLKTSAYPVSRVYKQLGGLKAKEAIVLLDACFSGAGGRSVIAKGSRPLVTMVEAPPSDAKVAVLAASSGDEITGSLDEQAHGLFTYYLLKGIQGAADAGRTGHVSMDQLYSYVKKSVEKAARRQNRDQTPQLFTSDPALKLY